MECILGHTGVRRSLSGGVWFLFIITITQTLRITHAKLIATISVNIGYLVGKSQLVVFPLRAGDMNTITIRRGLMILSIPPKKKSTVHYGWKVRKQTKTTRKGETQKADKRMCYTYQICICIPLKMGARLSFRVNQVHSGEGGAAVGPTHGSR